MLASQQPSLSRSMDRVDFDTSVCDPTFDGVAAKRGGERENVCHVAAGQEILVRPIREGVKGGTTAMRRATGSCARAGGRML
jgi:hypothetical protein